MGQSIFLQMIDGHGFLRDYIRDYAQLQEVPPTSSDKAPGIRRILTVATLHPQPKTLNPKP